MTTAMPFERGPYLLAAFICEKVLEEKDGVKSAIRIIDRVTRTVVDPSPPEKMEPFDHELTLLIKLKSGNARGVYPIQVRLVKPSGESPTPFAQNVLFEGEEDRGVDIVMNMKVRFDQTGIYWFHIYLGDVRLTQIPFRVNYVPQVRQVPG
ncbi:hypothetical protein ES703_07023 [subsurface metagenome]